MINPVSLATTLAALLAPALPHLLKSGEKVAEEAGKVIGTQAWEQVKVLWERLRPKVEQRPAAKEAVDEVAHAPADEDAVAALRLQLRKILAEDPTLAAELAPLAEQARGQINVTVSGDRSVGFGGDMSGGTIITGDRHSPRQS
jgi:hypothetical protein